MRNASKIKLLMLLVVILILSYSAVWFYGSGVLVKELGKAGLVWKQADRSGFPARVSISFAHPEFALAPSLRWQQDKMHLTILPYKPSHAVIVFEGAHALDMSFAKITLQAKKSLASIIAFFNLDRLSFDNEAVDIVFEYAGRTHRLAAKRLQLHARLLPFYDDPAQFPKTDDVFFTPNQLAYDIAVTLDGLDKFGDIKMIGEIGVDAQGYAAGRLKITGTHIESLYQRAQNHGKEKLKHKLAKEINRLSQKNPLIAGLLQDKLQKELPDQEIKGEKAPLYLEFKNGTAYFDGVKIGAAPRFID